MYVLIETAAGYALFKLKKDLENIKDIDKCFENKDSIRKLINLTKFVKFDDTKDALSDNLSLVEGRMTKKIKKLIKKAKLVDLGEKLVVTDSKLGRDIHEKTGLSVVCNSNAIRLRSCIMEYFEFLTSIPEDDRLKMSLALTHSMNRYKLKCNPDKIDTMIVQAISMLDDLDKEVNNYIMRCKEMYGWHFPELAKTVTDNNVYINLVAFIGHRDNALTMDMSDVLPEELIEPVKDIARTSCGSQLADEELQLIINLSHSVQKIQKTREKLYEYLRQRMQAVAPNLTIMIGELLGARLIARAGTLVNLAKYPSSTVQILGAEKALFRAKVTSQNTPKYGLLYHASMVGQTTKKGPTARMLANSAALCARKDAFTEDDNEDAGSFGMQLRTKLESNIRSRESGHHEKAQKKRKSGVNGFSQKRQNEEGNSGPRPKKFRF